MRLTGETPVPSLAPDQLKTRLTDPSDKTESKHLDTGPRTGILGARRTRRISAHRGHPAMTTSTAQAAPAAWYFTFQGVKQGPVTSAQLRTMAAEGKIAPADLVWKDGLPDWIPAAKVRGLFQNAAAPTANSHANPANPPQWRDAGGDATGGVIPYKNPPRTHRLLPRHPRALARPRHDLRPRRARPRHHRAPTTRTHTTSPRCRSRLDRHHPRRGLARRAYRPHRPLCHGRHALINEARDARSSGPSRPSPSPASPPPACWPGPSRRG